MQFNNLQEAIHYFKDEQFCREHLAKMRWPDGNVVCPKCGQKGAYRYCDFKFFKCKSRTCKNRFSVTAGSIYENTKIPLSKWFIAMYLISAHKKGISSCQLARDLGLGQKAGWFLLHRIRTLLADTNPELLTDVVEIDETYVGGKMRNKSNKKRKEHRDLNGYSNTDHLIPVMGLVQRDGRGILKVIGRNFSDDTLKEMVTKHVHPDAVVITDSHNGYTGLDKTYSSHQVINHSIEEYARGDVFTNTVEGFFSYFKRSIFGVYHQVSPKHLAAYCNENAYRYSTRKIKDSERFKTLLTKMDGRLRYKDLIKK